MAVRGSSPTRRDDRCTRRLFLTGLMIVILFAVRVEALPTIGSPHTCSLAEITHTNLEHKPEVLEAIRQTYVEETVGGPDAVKLGIRLSKERGGFWDVYFMGSAFSYSVTCINYVELASSEWNILLCQESMDFDSQECGTAPLHRYTNGTFTPELVQDPGPGVPLQYYNVIDESHGNSDSEQVKAARVPVFRGLVQSMTISGLAQPTSAEALQVKLSAVWKDSMWNVLIEQHPGGHSYGYLEQHAANVHNQLYVGVFDRRCQTVKKLKALMDPALQGEANAHHDLVKEAFAEGDAPNSGGNPVRI